MAQKGGKNPDSGKSGLDYTSAAFELSPELNRADEAHGTHQAALSRGEQLPSLCQVAGERVCSQ